ncbi:MAG: VOC family protein [Roseibium sp.]
MPQLNRIVLYVKDVDRSSAFYTHHFNFEILQLPGDRITELIPVDGGARLMLHKAGKAVKLGQASVKLSFNVKDVEGFIDQAIENGLIFGSIHQADGYRFDNAKDPDGNSIQVTSRPI